MAKTRKLRLEHPEETYQLLAHDDHQEAVFAIDAELKRLLETCAESGQTPPKSGEQRA